jgi:hypothetical protein
VLHAGLVEHRASWGRGYRSPGHASGVKPTFLMIGPQAAFSSFTALVSSAGELTCTISLAQGVSCTGTLKDWKQVYNDAVGAMTDLFESWFG